MSTSLRSNKRSLKQLLAEELAEGDALPIPNAFGERVNVVEIRGPTWVGPDTFAEVPAQASSRFPARGVSHAMLDAVRDVALYAASGNADAAHLVSKPEWTEAREGAGFPDLPKAEQMRQRMRLPHWTAVLAVVFLPAEQRRQAISTYTKKVGAFGRGAAVPALVATPVERSWIEQLLAADDMDDDILAAPPAAPELDHQPRNLPAGPLGVAVSITKRALKAVAHRVGHTPAASEYDHEVREMEDARRREGLPPLGFPSSDSVVARFGSWIEACRKCEMEPPARARRAPATLVEVIDASADFWGVVCGSRKVRAFAEACDIAVQFRTDPWEEILKEVSARRSQRGASMPKRATRRDARLAQMPTPEQAEQIREALGNPPSRFRPERTKEEALEGIRIYRQEHLGPNDTPTRNHYLAACRVDARLVWPSGLRDLTGRTFTQLIAAEGM